MKKEAKENIKDGLSEVLVFILEMEKHQKQKAKNEHW